MSRGPGKVERAIRQLMADEPSGAWTVEDLAERVYQGLDRVEKKRRVSVLRALKKFVEGDPDWGLFASENAGGTLILVNFGNVRSYALGRLKADHLESYRSKDPRTRDHQKSTEGDLLASLRPGGRHHERIQPGGAWWRHTRIHVARRDGDAERLAILEEEHARDMAEILAKLD